MNNFISDKKDKTLPSILLVYIKREGGKTQCGEFKSTDGTKKMAYELIANDKEKWHQIRIRVGRWMIRNTTK